MLIIIAIATAVSAADMAMEKRTKKYPSVVPGKRKRLNTAKISVLANVKEIESKLFVENSVLPETTLIGITKDNQLFVMGRNEDERYFTFIANHKYLHFSEAYLGQKQKEDLEQTLQGQKKFYVIKESL